ncbi:MAG: DUF2895 family protein, partial [Pseudomonadota bacterium]
MAQPSLIAHPFKRQLDEKIRQILLRERLIAILLVLLTGALSLAAYLSKHVTIHVQPGLNAVTTVQRDVVPVVNVYGFAERVMQELFRWPADGAQDYPRRIAGLAAYLTPRCHEWLERDAEYRQNAGELRGRQRSVQPAAWADPTNQVTVSAAGHWLVDLQFDLEETSRGLAVKDGGFLWRVPIVHRDVDMA